MKSAFEEREELEFWLKLLSNQNDPISHEVLHFLAIYLDKDIDCNDAEKFQHYRELFTSEIKFGHSLAEYLENSNNEALIDASLLIKEIIKIR